MLPADLKAEFVEQTWRRELEEECKLWFSVRPPSVFVLTTWLNELERLTYHSRPPPHPYFYAQPVSEDMDRVQLVSRLSLVKRPWCSVNLHNTRGVLVTDFSGAAKASPT